MRIFGVFSPLSSLPWPPGEAGIPLEEALGALLRGDEPGALRKSHYPEIPGSRLRQRHRLSRPQTPLEKGFNPFGTCSGVWEGGKIFLPRLGVCEQWENREVILEYWECLFMGLHLQERKEEELS